MISPLHASKNIMFWRTVCGPPKNACVHAWEGGIKEKGGKNLKRKEIMEIYSKVPEEKKNEAKILVDELCFILSTARKLKTQVRKEGAVEDFEQGSQKFKRESPALKSYNQIMKTFDTLYKNLVALIPKETFIPPEDEFDEFNK